MVGVPSAVAATPSGSVLPALRYWAILPSAMPAVAMSSTTGAAPAAGTAIDSGLVATAAPGLPGYGICGMPATKAIPIRPCSAIREV